MIPRHARAIALSLLPVISLPAGAAPSGWRQLNLPVGVTSISRDAYDLHMLAIYVCILIGIAVFGAMIYAMINFRKSKGAVADRTLTHSTKAEVIWTAIPAFILIFLAWQTVPALIHIEDTRDSDMTIRITGYQWKWHYEYMGEGVSFYSALGERSNTARQRNAALRPAEVDHYLLEVDEVLVLPVGAKIRYLISANDVIHAWWVPELGIKRDAIPGFINEGWFRIDQPGTYRGQCAELCGKDHGFMPIVVEALPPEEFAAWLAARRPAAQAALASSQP